MFNFGYGLLIFVTLATMLSMAAYAPGLLTAGRPRLKLARIGVYLNAVGLIITAGYLWKLLITHQFQVDYVFRYTSLDQPFRYIVAAFWGGQEGTFLLWAVYGGLLAVFLSFKAKQYEAPVQFFYLGINLFLMFMLLKRSPFALMEMVPPDGNGLNPLLQDPWMTIHPPIMFFGFASLGIPAAYAMAALVKEDWDNWVQRSIPWTIFGVLSLGTGLTLGGYWAYSILGWGGFWGWDPVENSSLVPWMFAVALLHNQIIQLRRGLFRRTNLILAMVPFLLLTYSTFLTRSGVLADFSVHSFTDLGINQFLAAFMIIFSSVGVALYLWKVRRVPVTPSQAPLSSREYFMFLGSLSFGLFAAFVLIGTSAPWFTRAWGPPASVTPEFYNRMGLPFAVFIGLLMASAPHLVWKRGGWNNLAQKLGIAASISLLFASIAFFFGVREPKYLAMLSVGFLAAVSNAQICFTIMRRNGKAAGGYLAHVGIGLALVGILASSAYDTTETLVLPMGEEVMSQGYGFKYLGRRPVEENRKDAYDVLMRTGSGAFIVSPTMYFSDFTAGMMKKPGIKMFWERDVYIAPISHAAEPVEDRIESKILVNKKQPQQAMGHVLTLQGFRTQESTFQDGKHTHNTVDIVAEINLDTPEGVVTIEPVLRQFPDGQTEVVPVVIEGSGVVVSLLGADSATGRAQLGMRQPPVAVAKGETADVGPFQVRFNAFDVQMPTMRGRSVKIYADATVITPEGEYDLVPGLLSRPGQEEITPVEMPIGRTGMNLVLHEVSPVNATASFYVAPAPQEYFYAEISTKPFIAVLWVGTAITMLGLMFAIGYRARFAGRVAAQVPGTQEGREAA